MAEEIEGQGIGAETSSAGVDPIAVSLALGGADREEANAFLRQQTLLSQNQNALIAEQRHHLHEQLRQLRLNIWEKYLGVLLRIATAFIGVAIAAALIWLVWNAANSNDLVIDSFAVPPDLAARGLSGPVVAAKLSDKIAAMQAATGSARPPKSYANGLSEGLKLEIPETGVSLSELDRFLREKLGHDLHIGGEMVQTDKGIALTTRVGNEGSATVTGAEADMDALLQNLAERVYRITQPYRYAVWANEHHRREEAVAILKDLSSHGPASERAWAYDGWAVYATDFQSVYAALTLLQHAHAVDPDNWLPLSNIAIGEYALGRVQDSLRDSGETLALLQSHGRDYSLPDGLLETESFYRSFILMYRGALLEGVEQARKYLDEDIRRGAPNRSLPDLLVELLAALHEPSAARIALEEERIPNSTIIAGRAAVFALHARLLIGLEAQDWPGVLTAYRALSPLLAQYPGLADVRATHLDPLVALALAHLGQFAAAEALLKPTPADCYPCLRARAQVAAVERQSGRSDFWFGRAIAISPSLPYADKDWGQSLLARSQPDAAIQKFTLANRKGPHFADPLEGWGEALMAKNQSHLALAKFEEADKYAPNWGRLHLKWGEALFYAGKKDEAQAQFARAAQLDLTPSEKAELARIRHG